MNATAASYVINLWPATGPEVYRNWDMAYPRTFANGVALPNGQVLIVGGSTYAAGFYDDWAVLVPELWSPDPHWSWTQLAPMKTPEPITASRCCCRTRASGLAAAGNVAIAQRTTLMRKSSRRPTSSTRTELRRRGPA